jgi:pimeloyl-ACP methyl ester carboxylesterase
LICNYISTNCRCVAIDMRGYNDSSKPIGIRQYSLNALVADVKAVIEGLGRDQCNVLVAHDWGGAVGYAFCARWPQMVGRYVALNIPHPSSIRYEQRMSWKQRLMSWYMVFFQCPVLPEIFFRYELITCFHEFCKYKCTIFFSRNFICFLFY